jgi:hypothetical protein
LATTGKGINVGRRMLSPGTSGAQDELRDLQTSQTLNTFLRAVVVRVIPDPQTLSSDDIKAIKQLVSNDELVDKMPRNTVIVRTISGGQDRRNSSALVCYPFLPSHISLPVKTSEQVWIMYENPEISKLPYWLWRVSEPMHVEDPNYTHADRKFDLGSVAKLSEKAAGASSKTPGFPNGGGTPASYTLNGKDDYETFISEDPAYEDFVPEPVPRFTKRPGDLTLQGSNNTLINFSEDGESKSGSIDIVAGRGQADGTAPLAVKNARGDEETDKNPEISGKKGNPEEGAVDFIEDLARIRVAMNFAGDDLLALKMPAAARGSIDNVKGSFLIGKSDEVRIVARKDGSIRFVKEGDVGGDQCAVLLLPDGVVHVDGDMLFLGRGGSGPGPNGSEPYIKFSVYKSQLTDLITELLTLLNAFATGYNLPVAIPGTPHPGLTSLLPSISTAISNLTILMGRLDEAQSKRIFGE